MYRRYFSDFYRWNGIVAILFAVACLLGIVRGGSWGRYWLIPACFVLLLLTNLRYYALFFTALRDRAQNRVEEKTICVRQIVRDKKYSYFNKGGALTGREKLLLIDPDGDEYRLAAARDTIVGMRPQGYYQSAEVVLRYLSRSRIVLHMRLSRAPKGTSQRLLKDFHEYFE